MIVSRSLELSCKQSLFFHEMKIFVLFFLHVSTFVTECEDSEDQIKRNCLTIE